MDEFNKFPCGHISPSPCQTLRSNDIRMRFGLLIDPPIGPQFSDKVLVFQTSLKRPIFKLESWYFAWRDIFGFYYYFVTLTLWLLRKNFWLIYHWKGQNIKIVKKWLIFKLESWSFAWRDIFAFRYFLVTFTLWFLRKKILGISLKRPKYQKSAILKVQCWFFVWGEIFVPDEDSTTLFEHFCMFLIGLIPHLKAQDNWESRRWL